MLETQVRSLGWKDALEEEMATHSSILAWRIPWTEEPCGQQSIVLQRVVHDWSELACTHTLVLNIGRYLWMRFMPRAFVLSCVHLFAPTGTVAHQTPLSMEFSRQEYWSGLPFPTPGDLPNPGIKAASPTFAGRFYTIEPPWKLGVRGREWGGGWYIYILFKNKICVSIINACLKV